MALGGESQPGRFFSQASRGVWSTECGAQTIHNTCVVITYPGISLNVEHRLLLTLVLRNPLRRHLAECGAVAGPETMHGRGGRGGSGGVEVKKRHMLSHR